MKKLISLVLFGALAFCLFGTNYATSTVSSVKTVHSEPAKNADTVLAQVVLTRKCCDGGGAVRCVLENWTPVGNPCFCYNQGWGYAC